VPSNLKRYERIAPFYDLLDLPFEYRRYRRIRPLLFAWLSGRILDAGVGTGRNMEFYPNGASVVGIDFSPAMLAYARRRTIFSPSASVELKEMDITRLDFPSGAFDGAVATFLFCVFPEDQQAVALRVLARVVRPNGTIRMLEYVRPSGNASADYWGNVGAMDCLGIWRRL
jgi:ubiquinone/menaquinone biosynthesis C-methylase UbiE